MVMNPQLIEKAVEKLCKFLLQSIDEQPVEDAVDELFSSSRKKKVVNVELEVAFFVSPRVHRVPLYFTVPHTFLYGSICLIVPPPQHSFKDKLQSLIETGSMKETSVASRVTRVIDTKKINEKATTPVSQRAFASSYDNFILYGVRKYPAQLSGEFFAHRKHPLWVAKKYSMAEALDLATRTVAVPRRGQNAVTCRIGHTGLSPKEITENILSLVSQLTEHSQGVALDHILHIRVTGTSAAKKRIGLPIFSHSFKVARSGNPKLPSSKKQKCEA